MLKPLSTLLLVVSFMTTVSSQETPPAFENISKSSGLNFVHYNGMQGKLLLPEIMGSGAALLDYDRDGDLDVFLVQGSLIENDGTLESSVFPWKEKNTPRSKLFRNDLKNGVVSFVDVTAESGIVAKDYGLGVAIGDVNNDGFPDIYILNLGANKLFVNKAGTGFEDKTSDYGVGDSGWGVSASFVDYDRDGFQDLFVANYADFTANKSPKCYSPSTARDYCGPRAFKPAANRFYKNVAGKKFEDVSSITKINTSTGHSLGVIAEDLNGDGLVDIYVANDGDANNLWINNGKGSFEDDAFFAGIAVNAKGQSEASMGVDVGDFNRDGKPDLFVTHLMEETHTLYSSLGDGVFEDITLKTGLNKPDYRLTGFGTKLFDFDNDGDLDIFVANGSVKLLREIFRPGNKGKLDPKYPLGQRNQVFENLGNGRFEELAIPESAGLGQLDVSRGAAFGDIDNDGDIDILVNNNSGKAVLMRNNVGSLANWVGIKLSNKNIPIEGTKIELQSGGAKLTSVARRDGSYASSNDPRVLFGVSPSQKKITMKVTWPDGKTEQFSEVQMKNYNLIEKGKGSDVSK